MRKKMLSINNMRAMALEESMRKNNPDKAVEIISISEYR